MGDREDDQRAATDTLKSPELRLLMEAEGVLPMLRVAQEASGYLLSTIESTQVPPASEPPSADESRHQAVWVMATQAHRALRSAMFLCAIGYPDQAIGFVRLITELHARTRKVYEDKSGEYARDWLKGRSGGSGAREIGQEFYEMLSGPPHATVRGTLDWTAISGEDGSTQVELGPNHRPEVGNSSLVFIAGEVRDIGVMLARVSGAMSHPPASLDTEIQGGYATFLSDAPADDRDLG